MLLAMSERRIESRIAGALLQFPGGSGSIAAKMPSTMPSRMLFTPVSRAGRAASRNSLPPGHPVCVANTNAAATVTPVVESRLMLGRLIGRLLLVEMRERLILRVACPSCLYDVSVYPR